MRPAAYLEGLKDVGSCHWPAALSSWTAGLLSYSTDSRKVLPAKRLLALLNLCVRHSDIRGRTPQVLHTRDSARQVAGTPLWLGYKDVAAADPATAIAALN